MFRSNFFNKFFKYKENSGNEIVKYNSNQKMELQEQIQTKIREIDQAISENSKSLLEVQIIKLRSTFSQSNNFIEKIGKNIYKTKIEESINWHQNQVKELYFRRRGLQIKLEKIQGIFWLNRIKRFLTLLFLGFFILLSLFIFLSGFMIIVYLMPLIILIILVYYIINKKY